MIYVDTYGFSPLRKNTNQEPTILVGSFFSPVKYRLRSLFQPYIAMFFLVTFYAIPYKNEYLTVGAAPLIIRDHMKLMQKFFINPDGKALDCHIITSK